MKDCDEKNITVDFVTSTWKAYKPTTESGLLNQMRYLIQGWEPEEVILDSESMGGIDSRLLIHGKANNTAARGGSNRLGVRKMKFDVIYGETGQGCSIKLSLQRSVKAMLYSFDDIKYKQDIKIEITPTVINQSIRDKIQ